MQKVQRHAAWLVVSPVSLLIGYWFAGAAIPDQGARTLFGPLTLWGILAVSTGWWQLGSLSRDLVVVRQLLVRALLIVVVLGGPLYAYAAIDSHAHARALPPERTFEIHRCWHRCYTGGYFLHQLPDGETIEGEYAGPALPYGSCATVQELVGKYGFSWVRVVDRMKWKGHELLWPIRREDCFSNKPLSSLKT